MVKELIMESLGSFKDNFQKEQNMLLLDAHTLDLVKEYCVISSQRSMTEPDADRLAEIIRLAEKNSCLELWINEADHFLDHDLGLSTGQTIYPFETANQKAALLEHLDFWSQGYQNIDQREKAAELIEEIREFLQSGSCEVQKSLKKEGYDPGPIDGIVGPRTQDAIVRFQKAHNLSTNGQLDPNTQSALGYGS